jgi:hypothetical protein
MAVCVPHKALYLKTCPLTVTVSTAVPSFPQGRRVRRNEKGLSATETNYIPYSHLYSLACLPVYLFKIPGVIPWYSFFIYNFLQK